MVLKGKYVKEQQIEAPEKTFRSLKQIREEYFPKAVERERLKEETPAEAATRMMKDILAEMMKK